MNGSRAKRIAAASVIALIVGAAGGWALSRSSGGVDANLTDPGVVQDPTIATNADTTGDVFEFVPMTSLTTGKTGVPQLSGLPTVVNFWFSTCQPCRREMPVLAAAATEYEGRATFIGIDPNDTPESARNFLSKYGVTYENYLDEMGDQLGTAKVGTMPTTYFLDARGRVVAMHAGELTKEDIVANLAKAGVAG